MSKHISRCLLYSNYYKNPTILQRFLIKTRLSQQYRLKHTEQIKPPKKEPKIGITWKSLTFLAVGAAGLVGIMKYIQDEKEAAREKGKQRIIGKAAIGGKWDLVDTKGQPVRSDDYLGKWVLIYFGFTHCPDVCPDEIEKMIEVVDNLEKDKIQIEPLLITVDPERDSKQALEKYCKEFSPKLRGLTGTVEQIGKVCKTFRVYFSAGPKDKDNDYIVDHTIILYLIDPDGEFVDYYGQNKKRDEIVANIIFSVAKWQAKNKKGLLW